MTSVSGSIDADDGMFKGDVDHYLSVGLSAVGVIEEALAAAPEVTSIREVLDIPCGYGRVLRFLVLMFPGARFAACEILPGAVDFCAEEFDADAIYSVSDLDNVTFDRQFDLIWCGSLLTHLCQDDILKLFNLFSRSIS
ncbi:MAG: class I SAM-dependent methyltransferase, partial [Pyrinomonadaceae bacterium]